MSDPVETFNPSTTVDDRFYFHKDPSRSSSTVAYPSTDPSPSDSDIEKNGMPLRVELPVPVSLSYRYVWIKTFVVSASSVVETTGRPLGDVIAAQRVVNDPPLANSSPAIRFGMVERTGASGGDATVSFSGKRLGGGTSLEDAIKWIDSENPGCGKDWLAQDGKAIAWQLHVIRVASRP